VPDTIDYGPPPDIRPLLRERRDRLKREGVDYGSPPDIRPMLRERQAQEATARLGSPEGRRLAIQGGHEPADRISPSPLTRQGMGVGVGARPGPRPGGMPDLPAYEPRLGPLAGPGGQGEWREPSDPSAARRFGAGVVQSIPEMLIPARAGSWRADVRMPRSIAHCSTFHRAIRSTSAASSDSMRAHVLLVSAYPIVLRVATATCSRKLGMCGPAPVEPSAPSR